MKRIVSFIVSRDNVWQISLERRKEFRGATRGNVISYTSTWRSYRNSPVADPVLEKTCSKKCHWRVSFLLKNTGHLCLTFHTSSFVFPSSLSIKILEDLNKEFRRRNSFLPFRGSDLLHRRENWRRTGLNRESRFYAIGKCVRGVRRDEGKSKSRLGCVDSPRGDATLAREYGKIHTGSSFRNI